MQELDDVTPAGACYRCSHAGAGRRDAGRSTLPMLPTTLSLAVAPFIPTCAPPPPRVKKKRIRKYRKLTLQQLQSKHANEISDSRVYNLTLDIQALKQEVHDYMVYKTLRETRSLVNRLNFNAGVMRTTKHHFELFGAGIRAWTPHEAAFFDATVADRIVVSDVPGSLESLFTAWRMVRDVIKLRRCTVRNIRVVVSDAESCVVECASEVDGQVTPELLKLFFPHVLRDRVLLAKVLGARLVYPTTTTIHFDAAGHMVQYQGLPDFFDGFSRIPTLSAKDVLAIMTDSALSVDSCLIANFDDWLEVLDGDNVDNVTSGADMTIESDVDFVGTTSSSYDNSSSSQAASPTPTHSIHSPSPLPATHSSASPSRSSLEYILS